jgi:hypothetical protein
METHGIIPVYVNIPSQGWIPAGVAQWAYIRGEIAATGSWMMLPKASTLSLAGYEYRFSWLQARIIELLLASVNYFTLANGVNAIRLSGYPVNVSTIHLFDLLGELEWMPETAEL